MTSDTPNASAPAEFAPGVQAGPLLGCIAAATLGGAILGATTNAITASFAAEYFRVVLRWWNIQDVWRAAVAEGVFEGLLFGFFGALVFALFVGITTRCRVGFSALARGLLLAAATAVVGWAFGGVIGIGIAHLSVLLKNPKRRDRKPAGPARGPS